MRRHVWLIAIAALAVPQSVFAQSWIFRPAAYTHSPETGERVAQHTPERQPYYRADDTYLESGYRHYRSAIRGPDGSYDYQHIVQTWGLGEAIRPYGEWQFPYRAGATPYGPWGNPSGPWTLPYDSWVNPYGLGKIPYQGGYPGGGYGPQPVPYGPRPNGSSGGAWHGPTSPTTIGPPAGPGPWAPGEMP